MRADAGFADGTNHRACPDIWDAANAPLLRPDITHGNRYDSPAAYVDANSFTTRRHASSQRTTNGSVPYSAFDTRRSVTYVM